MRTNVKSKPTAFNHEGTVAASSTHYNELRRAVMACLLWEDQFYESGQSIADRIKSLVATVPPEKVSALAIEARTNYKLRHAPLLLVRELARKQGSVVGRTITQVIQRADELSEFLSIYWKDGKQPLSKQVKIGLANAFPKFNAYQLAKYRGDDKNVKLRDVLFLTHAKPKDEAQGLIWKKLVDGSLESPDTWEVSLSAGADKKETFERLIREKKLGYLALLRNLRKMLEVGCDESLIQSAIAEGAKDSKALPFRFIAASRAAPRFEPYLDAAMQIAVADMPKLPGKTTVLVDVSGSMDANLSGKSDLTRMDAACGLAIMARELCEDCRVFAFSNSVKEIPARRGMALTEAIQKSMPHGGTDLGRALEHINKSVTNDRLIVVTDEQSQTAVGAPKSKGYIINVASYKNGIGYGPWTRLDGFSEAVLTYIQETEKS